MANAATGLQYDVGEILKKVVGRGVWIYPILFRYYRHLNYMFLDLNQKKSKSIKTKMLPNEATITEDGKSLVWYDYSMFDFDQLITAPVAAATTINVGAGNTAGLAANDTVRIVPAAGSATTPVTVDVVSVDDVTGNVVVDVAVTCAANDRLVRAFYVQEDYTEITRGQSKYQYIEYKSYFQNFAREVSFLKEELNKTYALEADAKEYVSNIFAHNINILLQELSKAIYLGRNVAGTRGEMLGIETLIQELETATAGSAIHDLSGAANDAEKIEGIMNAIEAASASGAIMSNEPLMIVANQKFLSALARLNQDKIVHNDVVTSIDFKIMKLTNTFGTVEFVHDPILDIINRGSSVGYILPRSLMSMRFRQNQRVIGENGQFESAVPEVKVLPKITNVRDQEKFDLFFECAIIFGGISSGVYKKIENL